jgi:hypothetical protein
MLYRDSNRSLFRDASRWEPAITGERTAGHCGRGLAHHLVKRQRRYGLLHTSAG